MISLKNIYTKIPAAFLSAVAVALGLSAETFAAAKDIINQGSGATGASGQSLEGGIEIVTNILLFLIGTIAVIAIIIGGIKYTTSNGDASSIKSAKDTILYAVIGLIVAIMAYGIVRWVVNLF